MPNAFDLSVLISQMPRVQKMQGDAQSFPGVMQGRMAREVLEKQRRQQHEVPRAEKGEGTVRIKTEDQKRHSQGRQAGRKSRNQDEEQPPESGTGHFIDLEV